MPSSLACQTGFLGPINYDIMSAMPFRRKLEEIFGADLRALGFFRIALSLLVFHSLLSRLLVLRSFYTDDGLFSSVIAQTFSPPWNFSIHYHFGSLGAQILIFSASFVVNFLFLVGYRTRLAGCITWLLFLSLSLRNAPVNHGGNHLMWVLLFWSQFLPLGARYSVDRILAERQADFPAKEIPVRILSAGTAAFVLQIVLIYWCSGYSKLLNEEWAGGKAVYYALALKYYTNPFGLFLLNYPAVMKILTHAVLAFELLGPGLLLMPFFTLPLRLAAILGFMVMHLGFALGLNLDLFPWASMSAMLPLIPSFFWDRLEHSGGWFEGKKKVFQSWAAAVLDKFKIMRTYKKSAFLPSRRNNFLATFFLTAMVALSFESFGALQVPILLRFMSATLHIEQFWFMFVPPGNASFWVVAPGKLKDETIVDLFKNGKPLDWEQPVKPSGKLKNRHWQIIAEDLAHSYIDRKNPRGDILSPHVADYLCREWNAKYSGGKRLQEVQLVVLHKPILSDYGYGPVQKSSPFEHTCRER